MLDHFEDSVDLYTVTVFMIVSLDVPASQSFSSTLTSMTGHLRISQQSHSTQVSDGRY